VQQKSLTGSTIGVAASRDPSQVFVAAAGEPTDRGGGPTLRPLGAQRDERLISARLSMKVWEIYHGE